MSRAYSYRYEFVRSFPDRLEEDVLYVSVEFGNTAHRCFCGCGQEVYARLSPRDWMMIFDGETVSLDPSIGNWSFPCPSHYWLDRGRVAWAERWTPEQIERGRAFDGIRKSRYYREESAANAAPASSRPEPSFIRKYLGWLIGR